MVCGMWDFALFCDIVGHRPLAEKPFEFILTQKNKPRASEYKCEKPLLIIYVISCRHFLGLPIDVSNKLIHRVNTLCPKTDKVIVENYCKYRHFSFLAKDNLTAHKNSNIHDQILEDYDRSHHRNIFFRNI